MAEMTNGTSNSNVITVMIVDDHDLVRMGLKMLIEGVDELHLVAEASSGVQAVELYERYRPDVVLMDILMPEMDGIAATKTICGRYRDARIITLTSYTGESPVRLALEAGAISYLLKDVTPGELVKAIQDAVRGRPTLAPTATQAIIKTLHQPTEPEYHLTPSEIEVLKWVAQGLSNTQIAAELVVSTSTVKKHVSNILTKLNVSNRAEAAAWAVRHDLMDA